MAATADATYRRYVEIPDAVRSSVVLRLRQLDRVERGTIMRAAAIGPRFDVALLLATATCGDARVRMALARACDLQLIVLDESGSERYAFRHAMTREIVYGELVADRVRKLHRRIGGALERTSLLHSDALPELAHHYGLAGDADRARRFNELAGDHAASVHANVDARTYYQRAQRLLQVDSNAFARIARKLNALSVTS